MRSCDGFTCSRLTRVSFDYGGKIYQNGVKYCKTCSKFLRLNSYRCPCCKSNVRSKSHTKKWREDHLHNVLFRNDSNHVLSKLTANSQRKKFLVKWTDDPRGDLRR